MIGAAAIVVVAIVAIPWLVSRARFAHELNQSRATSIPISAAGTVASPGLELALPPLTAAATRTSAPSPAPATATAHSVPTAATVPPPLREPVSGWSVQVASLTDSDAAAKLAAGLIHAGFKAFVSPHLLRGKTWYRVRVGPYPDAASAEAAAPKIAAVSGTKVIVRRLGGAGG